MSSKVVRVLAPNVTKVQNAVAATTTVAAVAAAAGITQEEAEHRLMLLVDEKLVTRTTGDRQTARYAVA